MIDEKKLIEELRMEYECADDLSDFTCGVKRGLSEALTIVKYQPKVGEWIPVEERLPEEHDSFFVNFKGTEHWRESMNEKNSDPVLATIEYKNGRRKVYLMRTIDGEWDTVGLALKNGKVLAWQSFPEPFCE